jgi:hypothetical protein
MFTVSDWLDAILLGTFFFGLIFTALSLFLGIVDIGIDHGGHDVAVDGSGHQHLGHDSVAPLTVGTILAFLTWFGGVAYLARNGLGIYSVVSVLLGLAGGLAGGYAVYWLLKKVKQAEQDRAELWGSEPGTIARVSSSIRAGGTGEIIYETHGVRHVAAARSATGEAIARGTVVVILRTERGIAYVEPWDRLLADRPEGLRTGQEPPRDQAASHRRNRAARSTVVMRELPHGLEDTLAPQDKVPDGQGAEQ